MRVPAQGAPGVAQRTGRQKSQPGGGTLVPEAPRFLSPRQSLPPVACLEGRKRLPLATGGGGEDGVQGAQVTPATRAGRTRLISLLAGRTGQSHD